VQCSSVGCVLAQLNAGAAQWGAAKLMWCSVAQRLQRSSKKDAVKLSRVQGGSEGCRVL
jgi:hypothetical protein